MNQVWLALITGLTTGGISCFAVQRGLLASSLANQEKGNQKKAVAIFVVAKIVAYTILGALLGLIGSSLVISPKTQGLMQIFAGLVMLIAVGKLLNLHPIFQKLTFTAPKFMFKILRNKSKDEGMISSAFLGFLTILIPCGITQSIMVLSVASGSALNGALLMLAFTVGTSPVFFGLGIASSEILKRPALKYVAATAIFILAILSFNTGQILRGSPHTLQNYWYAIVGDKKESGPQALAQTTQGFQEAEIIVSSSGYKSNVKTLKAGVPVKLKLKTDNTFGCARAFTIPSYNISKFLPESGETEVEFTPTKTGRLTYTCSMGMYSGVFEVI